MPGQYLRKVNIHLNVWFVAGINKALSNTQNEISPFNPKQNNNRMQVVHIVNKTGGHIFTLYVFLLPIYM